MVDRVERTEIVPGVSVSTIALPPAYVGLDLGGYETVVFDERPGRTDPFFETLEKRYATREQAEEGHAQRVEIVRNYLAPKEQ